MSLRVRTPSVPGRPRPSRGWLAGLVALTLLAGCAPKQRTYATDPVGPRGESLPLEQRVVQIVFEDQETRSLAPGEDLEFRDGRFVLYGTPDAEGQRPSVEWDAGLIQGLEYVDADGQRTWFDVKTPDDLDDFDRLPPLDVVVLRDGRRIPVSERGLDTRWSSDRLALRIGESGQPLESYETLSLEDVAEVQLHEPNLVDATLRSRMFWVATAAATTLFVLLNQEADDNDAVR